MIVASHVPDHRSLLPTVCETCAWPLRSYSDLSCRGRRVSADNWPVHGRFHGSFRGALPVCRGFCDSCSSRQMWLWHLSLSFSEFVAGVLLHQDVLCRTFCSFWSWSFPTDLSLDRAQEHAVGTQLGLDRSVLEKLSVTVCCIPNSFQRTYSHKNRAQTSATKKTGC